ncbi:MAG: hypothetical protein KAG53_08240 [Endozoicomonadaceae bacterium]|nr:hypothetical protein [Endozoicomonadaceae bacterium]
MAVILQFPGNAPTHSLTVNRVDSVPEFVLSYNQIHFFRHAGTEDLLTLRGNAIHVVFELQQRRNELQLHCWNESRKKSADDAFVNFLTDTVNRLEDIVYYVMDHVTPEDALELSGLPDFAWVDLLASH